MTRCCGLTRREIMQWGAIVAASPLLSALADPERAYGLTRAAAANPAVPIHLELVTLTETTAILTWFTGDPTRLDEAGRPAPMPADTEVLLGTSPTDLRQVFYDATATPYHYVELSGLEPGRPYVYLARSGGAPATSAVSAFGFPAGTSTANGSPSGPFLFTTPKPPPGSFLFAIALCNDLHLGETVAGLATTQGGVELPPGIRQREGQPPYPEVMASALATETRQRGANVLLAAGDLSSEAAQLDVDDAKQFLDAFGTYEETYLVARGNHDRPHTGDKVAACSAVPGADGYHDCFRDSFFPSGDTWFARQAFGLRLLGLDTYDKIGNGGDNGVMSDGQFAFVRDQLTAYPDQPTLVFGHHPITLESSLDNTRPLLFDLATQQSLALEQLYASSPGVVLHHAGHTHRNKLTTSITAPHVTFQEVAAVKEYPGGFHLLRVHTGGYALNFYKFRDALAREWTERSRPEYGGQAPFYTFGTSADRNTVVARDLSGLHSAATSESPPIHEAAVPNGRAGPTLPATGSDRRGVTLAAATAAAAAVSAELWLQRAARR
jgi:hypothetical protein